MARIFKKRRLLKIMFLLLGSLFIGFFTMKLDILAKSDSPYYIKVNKQQNCVTIYKKDENGKFTIPVKAMVCSTGVDTPLGVYNTQAKYRWKLLMGDVWGQYSTRIVNGILFHSVWYYEMDASTLSAAQFNKLGTAASHGCVRLNVADAKWIYDNCSIGTTVEIYNAKDPGPLGKPDTIKIPVGSGWDPTDPSSENPYKNKMPSIKGAESKSLAWGTKTDLLSGIKATSTTGTDITSKLKVDGKVDIYTAGKYKIKYSVTDATGKTTAKTITITVKECTQKPDLKGITDKVIAKGTVVNRDFALEGVTAYLTTKKLSTKDIKVSIKETSDTSYTITYSIKAENDKTAKATAKVYVDTTAPVLNGIYYRAITLAQYDAGKAGIQKLALKNVTAADDYAKLDTEDIKVTVKAKEDYAYLVTYTVTDDVGNKTSETVQFSYFKGARIDGVANHFNLPSGTKITEQYVKQGITAANSENEECTEVMSVKITTSDNLKYKVTYSVTDIDGTVITISCYYTVQPSPEGTDETGEETDTSENTTENTADNTNLDTTGNTTENMSDNTSDSSQSGTSNNSVESDSL